MGCGKSTPSAPAAPVLPQVPELSPEEREAIQKAGVSIDQFQELLSEQRVGSQETQNILKTLSGLYDEGGALNQEALTGLQERLSGTLQKRTALGDLALDYLGTFFDESSDSVMSRVRENLLRSLSGEANASEGLQQRTAKEFEILKESAGRRGIRISGDTFEEAVNTPQESSAAGRLLSEAKKRYDLSVEQERQYDISTGAQTLGFLNELRLSNLGFAGGLATQTGADVQSQLGFLTSASDYGSAANLDAMNAYLTLANARMGLAQPYEAQRLAQYNQQTQQVLQNYNTAYQNYAQQMQARQSFYGGLGQLGGLAGTALLLNPATMPMGAAVLGGTAALGFLS